jgi:hypothetical protein
MMRLLIALLVCCLAAALASADGLDALKAAMGDTNVKIEKKARLTEGDEKKPSLKGETWTFAAGAAKPQIHYTRYLNVPPHFTGQYPSLAGYDMGVGLDGGPFGNWYRGNCLRVLVNGHDIMAAAPATRVESKEGPNGYLRFIWEFNENRKLALNFLVPDDGHAIFLRVDLTLPGMAVESIKVSLHGYPGGFGPAHGIPSHRYAYTSQGAAGEVPPDFKPSEAQPYPALPLTPADTWVFYGDKHEKKGALGLLLPADALEGGAVKLSNYGVTTSLDYPLEARKLYIGLYAYEQTNEAAEATFKERVVADREFMINTAYWPE